MQEMITKITQMGDGKKGAGKYDLSPEDRKQYEEYLKLTPEQREKKLQSIKERQKLKIGPVSEADIDEVINNLPSDIKSKIKTKGGPPPKYLRGTTKNPTPPPPEIKKTELRLRNIIKSYLETGGISPITGKQVPFSESQLDHITSLDNGGKDEPDNWMWMESRLNQYKGKLTDKEVEAKLVKDGLKTVNEIAKSKTKKN